MAEWRVHPVVGVPAPAVMAALGAARTLELFQERERMLVAMARDPLRHGYEPPSWELLDAIQGFPWVDEKRAREIREGLGLKRRVQVLLLLGMNRSGKSRYAARTMVKLLMWKPRAVGWAFHENANNSVEMQQPYVHEYLPLELRGKAIKTQTTYVSYTGQNGFAESRFLLPNMSRGSFRSYDQDPKKSEGGEVDLAWCDEDAPLPLVQTLVGRIATRRGNVLITYTPIHGANMLTREFLTGADVRLESAGWFIEAAEAAIRKRAGDGGSSGGEEIGQDDRMGRDGEEIGLVARGLGVSVEQARGLMAANRGDGKELSVWSMPESLDEIMAGVPEDFTGRVVPRVAGCVDPSRAVVWMHGRDCPFGNPASVYELWKGSGPDDVERRLYGIASGTTDTQFPRFTRKVHVVRKELIPVEQVTRYHFLDPASRRNPFMHWWARTRERKFLYREWPGNYEIPGARKYEGGPGPGPWALPDGKHPDGKKGPAQQSFGFGLLRWKAEIARLEGWEDWAQDVADQAGGRTRQPVQAWTAEHGARERVRMRFIDSRAASSPKVEKDRPVTLMEELERIGLWFELTPGFAEMEGIKLITSWLDWDETQELGFLNQPGMVVSEECGNTIFSLETYTGEDGQKGACKDPIDLLCYEALEGCAWVDEAVPWVRPGRGVY